MFLRNHMRHAERSTSEEGVVCERKYVGAAALHDAALSLLSHHCLPDPSYPYGQIESIYFDDEWLSSFWEKANGDIFKRKVRVRWYPSGCPAGEGNIAAFLEIKDRNGATRSKRHVGFSADGALLNAGALEDAALTRMLYEQADKAGLSLPIGLTPTVSVRYHRHRFICPLTGTRVCLDSRIHSGRANFNRFADTSRLDADLAVCEAKSFAGDCWTWSDALARLGFRPRSFSKYGFFMEARLQ
ncbi:MAG: polyphosphate polymerase domain-containing protein [Kiritimatiellae bacterium]|nr:polyphosphate polymerase domain-containing protein [Kiritimatiellia bacterium]